MGLTEKAHELRDEVVDRLGIRRRIRAWIGIGALAGFLLGASIAATIAALYWPEPGARVKSTMREAEVSVEATAIRSDGTTIAALGLRCGMEWITGTHAEHWAKGRLCRVKVSITNNSLVTVPVANMEQRLLLADGSQLGMDLESMEIKRQLRDFTLGASNTVTQDLWFDVPLGATPAAILLRANADSPQGRIELPRRDWTPE